MRTALRNARVEKDVENAYREAIHRDRSQALITSPHGTDGYATWSPSVRLLLEVKFDLDFKARVPICNTLGQCLFYIKKFEQSGELLPNVILVGDRNECFVLSTEAVRGFLDLPLDWAVAPSKGNPDLTRALVAGLNILPYVYDVDGAFRFRDVLEKVETLAKGEQHTIRATPVNIGAIFSYWKDRVFGRGTLTAVEQVDVFLKCLFRPTDVYLHPVKLGVLVTPGYPEGVPISAEQYRSFFSHFVQGYKPSEVEAFYAEKDRLVEDDARRRQGAFFTPALWVDEAHKMVSDVLGPNWKDECIVWDPAAGTGNLTRDHHFADLILSTAEKPDIDVIVGQGYNSGAEVFQYDFLNPGVYSSFLEGGQINEIPDTAHARLEAAAKAGKRLVFLMNPPYGTANNAGTEEGDHKAGIALTSVNGDMKRTKIGASSQQLYAQFMFQASKLAGGYGFSKVTVATFSVPTFMCSGSYRGFRDFWYARFGYQAGMLFQASHFADVSGRWGIAFTIWSEGAQDPNMAIPVNLKDVPEGTFAITKIGGKSFYSSDGREASKWVREPLGKAKGVDAPQMSSGLVCTEKTAVTLAPSALGYMMTKGNGVMENGTGVTIVSSSYTNGHGCSVLPGESFRRCAAIYAARKLVPEDWQNQKDEYLAPVVTPVYEQWVNDCHVYGILHGSNNCTSRRSVPYKDKTWTIHNHFFWKTRTDALTALDTAATPTLYRDCKQHPAKDVFGNPVISTPDPYMAYVLPTLILSPEAQTVLDKLNALWLLSLPMREAYAAGKPELHLMSWDAGSFQCKHLWRDLFPVEWKDLQAAFKILADNLRPGVYEHGFLLK